VIHDHMYAPLPLPRSIKPDFPEALERVLLKALTKDRNDRYASVSEFYAAFDQAANQIQASVSSQSAAVTAISNPIDPTTPIGPATSNDPLATRASSVAAPKSKTRLWITIGALALIVVAVITALVLSAPQLAAPTGAPPVAANSDLAEPIKQLRENFAQANSLALQGQADQARSAFADVAKQAEQQLGKKDIAPDQQAQLRVIASDAWLAANKPDKAQPHLKTLAQQAPNNPEPQVGLAAVALMQNNLDDADAALSRALRASPDLAAARALRACVLLKRGEPLRAAREFAASGLVDYKGTIAPWIKLVLAELDCRAERFKQ
jgi:tetratricopeptide (TPR) repeat protein